MRKRRRREDGEGAKPKTGRPPGELRRAEDKIRRTFALMDGPEFEDLPLGRK